MPKSRRCRCLVAALAGLQVSITSTAAAQEQTSPGRPVLRIAYFIPSDRKPEPDYVARLDRVMTHVQRFYREGMEQNGHGPLTFELDRGADGKLRVYEVRGQEPMRAYGRDASDKVRDEVKEALARQKIDIDPETFIIFQLLLEWKGAQAVEIGPYVGGGDGRNGTAWVYDDARLDPDLLASLKPGGFYVRPCSLGEFNSHYLGGVAHELGHALGLPHERERPAETARRGTSLMGAGNHTWGQELRGEWRGTFLTAAAALPLSVHPLFTGRRQTRNDLTCQITELDATAEKGKLVLAGRLTGGPRVAGLVAYNDRQSIPGDYDASGWTSRVDSDGRFELTIEDLEPGIYDLRLRPLGAGGDSKHFPFIYEVNGEGRPLVEPLLEGPWLLRAFEAYRAGDKTQLAAVAAEAKEVRPRATVMHKKIAHYEKLASAVQPQRLAEMPKTTTTVHLANVELEAATTGWGPALRDQVSLNGDASGLLEVGGNFFESGLYAHAPARHAVRLDKGWKTLSTKFGLQDRHAGSVVFVIKGDGKEIFRSPVIKDHEIHERAISVASVTLLELIVEDAGDGANSDWGVWLDPQLRR
jgi:hypothetical protein